jgi:hypothetical protein
VVGMIGGERESVRDKGPSMGANLQ